MQLHLPLRLFSAEKSDPIQLPGTRQRDAIHAPTLHVTFQLYTLPHLTLPPYAARCTIAREAGQGPERLRFRFDVGTDENERSGLTVTPPETLESAAADQRDPERVIRVHQRKRKALLDHFSEEECLPELVESKPLASGRVGKRAVGCRQRRQRLMRVGLAVG